VLAGGKGNSMCPLSRENYPKQFMDIKGNRSLLQETIVRNIPFCEEFYISTSEYYHFIVENQMKVFQGLKYRCFLEDEGKKTAPVIALICMFSNPSELIFVVSSDQIIEGENYKDTITMAIELARKGDIVIFGLEALSPYTGYDYINYLWNSGNFIVRAGDFLQELKKYAPDIYYNCKKVMKSVSGTDKDIHFTSRILKDIPAMSVEHVVLEKSKKVKVIQPEFRWFDVGDLEMLTDYTKDSDSEGVVEGHHIADSSIVKLEPAFKDYLWGGTKLKDIYQKKCDYDIIAESWELSSHKDGQSVIAEGKYKGMLFSEYLKRLGAEKLGWKCQAFERFPILIKFIDARQSLSIQVHPDDEYALREENEYGKNELWYIMDCDEGASIYYGVKEDISKEEFEERIQKNTILEVLNKVEVHQGDTYFVAAGTIHAIGAGILICEIQQNSNCTYRLYDYDRRDKYGNLRKLHIKKGKEVSRLETSDNVAEKEENEIKIYNNYDVQLLGSCKYFESIKYHIYSEAVIEVDETSFCSITIIEGSGAISVNDEALKFKALDSFFIPAGKKKIIVRGKCSLIKTYV